MVSSLENQHSERNDSGTEHQITEVFGA